MIGCAQFGNKFRGRLQEFSLSNEACRSVHLPFTIYHLPRSPQSRPDRLKEMPRIVVNGKEEQITDETTIAQFLQGKGVSETALVERNMEIVKRDRYTEVQLQDGDELEVVQMMAGG